LGVAEMTRFGMEPEDFRELAGLMARVIREKADVRRQARDLRRRFLDMRFCFNEADYEDVVSALRGGREA
jgi:aminomethyltransferase